MPHTSMNDLGHRPLLTRRRATIDSHEGLAAVRTLHPSNTLVYRSPDAGERDHATAFAITHISEADRNVLAVRGELDLAAEREFHAVHQHLVGDRRPLVIDCTGVSFIDCSGLKIIVNALGGRPQNRLANVPAHMGRLVRMLGLDHIVDRRTRHDVAIATYDGVDVICAARICEVFEAANAEGCSYDLSALPFDATTSLMMDVRRNWHCVIVSPVDRWMALSPQAPLVRWVRRLLPMTERVVGVGTGLLVLAAAGCLDGRRVAADSFETILATLAPRAVLSSRDSMTDGPVVTAANADGAITQCLAIVAGDYGHDVRRQVEVRLLSKARGRHATGSVTWERGMSADGARHLSPAWKGT